jgi:hypothetical protein
LHLTTLMENQKKNLQTQQEQDLLQDDPFQNQCSHWLGYFEIAFEAQ